MNLLSVDHITKVFTQRKVFEDTICRKGKRWELLELTEPESLRFLK